MRAAALGVALGLLVGLPNSGLANDLLATEQFSGTVMSFQLRQGYSNLTLRVAGPHEFSASVSQPNGAPAIDLSRFGAVYDGTYTYHLTGTTGEVVLAGGRENGRSANTATPYKLRSVSKSGNFAVRGGAIVAASATPRKTDR